MENGPQPSKDNPVLKARRGDAIATGKPVYALWRCGRSANKPFCDRAHQSAGFRSANGDARIRNIAVSYSAAVEGQQVTVSYTPVLCGHISECQRLHKAVFDQAKSRGFSPETERSRASSP